MIDSDFNHVWEAVSQTLLEYECTRKIRLEEVATLISDLTDAVIKSGDLRNVPDRERYVSLRERQGTT